MITDHQAVLNHINHTLIEDVGEEIGIIMILVKAGEITTGIEISPTVETEEEGTDNLLGRDLMIQKG